MTGLLLVYGYLAVNVLLILADRRRRYGRDWLRR